MRNNKRKKFKSVQTFPKNQSLFESKIVNELNNINSNIENVNNQLESLDKKKPFSRKEFILSVLIAVIATILSSIITSLVSNVLEQSNYKKSVFDAAENICIGSSKEWMDSKFGVPNFSCMHPIQYEANSMPEGLDILECCYILDEIVIRAFYEYPANSCCLFLVTQRTEKMSYELHIPYSPTGGKPLGKFTYYEIEGKPLSVFGFDYQGFVRDLYGEFYYANYHHFVFMTLDYGYIEPNFFIGPLFDLDYFLDDEIDISKIKGLPMDAKRDSVHPNTYGISALSEEATIMLVENYDTFDSFWPFFEKY